MSKEYSVEFTYPGCGRMEFFTERFTVADGENLHEQIKMYVREQNKGEAKSDRIRFTGKIKPIK